MHNFSFALAFLAVLASVFAHPHQFDHRRHRRDAVGPSSQVSAQIPVTTLTTSSEVVQKAKNTPPPQVLGVLHTELDTQGESTAAPPFPTGNPYTKGDLEKLSKTINPATFTEPVTVTESLLPTLAAVKRENDVVLEEKDVRQRSNLGKRDVANIFTPISTAAPPAMFAKYADHPVKPLNVSYSYAKQTNKFYANMLIGTRNDPVFVQPYSVWWSKGNPTTPNDMGAWGMSIAHIDDSQKVFGAGTVAPYYLNPIFIRSMSLSATEFKVNVSDMQTSQLGPHSVVTTLYQNATVKTSNYIQIPLCQGMGFVSGIYNALTPMFESQPAILSLAKATAPRAGIIKYRLQLNDQNWWAIYIVSTSTTFNLTLVNQYKIQANSAFTGLIQIGKLGTTGYSMTKREAMYDTAAGAYCTGATTSGSLTGSTGSYSINFSSAGSSTKGLMMWAQQHHIASFAASMAGKNTGISLLSPTKGAMTAILPGNVLAMSETALPINVGWLPLASTGSATISAANLKILAAAAANETAQNFDEQSDLDTMYFSGKGLGKFAMICLTISDVLKDKATAAACLAKLKTAFAPFVANQQNYPLVYDQTWGGVISSLPIVQNDFNADFGGGLYNDHHFHYAYFIHAAAVIAHIDQILTGSTTWRDANKEWVNTLVRDASNPSQSDTYFPISRGFDWWSGHSWAKGIISSWDGKDEESTSEDIHFAYGLKLWGNVLGDATMEARGNIMLAVLKRAINTYFYTPTGSTIHPAKFIGNKVTGILFENKVDHTTYFGTRPEQIHGIHMMPLTAGLHYVKSSAYASEEWADHFNGKTGAIVDGWKGVLYGNAALFAPAASWSFFSPATFSPTLLDGGASRTWYLAFAAALGGAA